MPKDLSQYKIQDKDIFGTCEKIKDIEKKERKKREPKPVEEKLTCPVKTYFREDDYKILDEISRDDGLDPASFIRNIVKREIKLRKN